MSSRTRAVAACAALGAGLACPGCGEESLPPAAAAVAATGDVKFPSLESLVDELNGRIAATPADGSSHAAVVEQLYAENDLQRRLLEVSRAATAWLELTALAEARFGEVARHGVFSAFDVGATGPLEIVDRDDARARATFPDLDGRSRDMHFVKVGGRWWVSGYTLERHEEAMLYEPVLDELPAMAREHAAICPEIARRLQAQEIGTIKALGRAMNEAFSRRASGDRGDGSRRVMEIFTKSSRGRRAAALMREN